MEEMCEAALNQPAWWENYSHTLNEPDDNEEIKFAIDNFLPLEGIAMIGGLPSAAKTWFVHSIIKAITINREDRHPFPQPASLSALPPWPGGSQLI
jgi:hypothetical protein